MVLAGVIAGLVVMLASCSRAQPAGDARGEEANAPDQSSSKRAATEDDRDAPPPVEGMVWIAGGEYRAGSVDPLAWPAEQPMHRVRVDGFYVDVHEVTNTQYRAFVEATGYVTVAERPVDWDELKKQLPPGTPRPPDEALRPGSLVFTPPDHPVDLRDYSQWWTWTPGANWQQPLGPGSSIEGMDDHPVVHIAWEDAVAYCDWAGKRLPTEAEWEFAARGGLDAAINTWGDAPIDATHANTWQGQFPNRNTQEDGHVRTAPVMSYPANGYGLHDMAGNVWEWCSDWYRGDAYVLRTAGVGAEAVISNPSSPDEPWDPNEPLSRKRVTRGGSFLCNDSYCASYRPSARIGTAFDTGMSHLGFRCVKDAEGAARDSNQHDGRQAD